MHRIIKKANFDPADVEAFTGKVVKNPFGFFECEREIFISRAPGRLDVMGGIADYSGSLVLEMPIAEATFAALQKRSDKILKICSEDENENLFFEMPLDIFEDEIGSYSPAREFFNRDSKNHWASYIAGVFVVLMREKNITFETGANIFISSGVPQGKGVSSSAALEAAVMSAVSAAFSLKLNPVEAAMLCQKVENSVVGAPCGIMDQMTVICGGQNELLSLICQPADLLPPIKIPGEILFCGIDSGVRHAVAGADYGSVRTGAFMGYRMIAELAGLPVKKAETENVVKIAGEKWNGYLANISPLEFEKNFAGHLPAEISGREFLEKYQGITDRVTTISPDKIYPVLTATAHPVHENSRVNKFASLLSEPMTEENLIRLGELMYAAHESYSACGLGTNETDLLVELVRKNAGALYGAKITGGGSGGTVAVLGRKNGGAKAIREISAEYEKLTKHRPHIFNDSSPGSDHFGFIEMILI